MEQQRRHQRRSGLLAATVTLALVAAACQGPPTSPATSEPPVAPGDRAPDFRLSAAGGNQVTLGDYRGERAVLLYFSMGPG